jgi:hypothetical protein
MESNVIAARTAILRDPGGPIGAAQGVCGRVRQGPDRSRRQSEAFGQAINQLWLPSLASAALRRVGQNNGKRYRRHHPASRPGGNLLGRLAGTYPF